MAHMLAMPAAEVCDPVTFFVLMIPDDRLLHPGLPSLLPRIHDSNGPTASGGQDTCIRSDYGTLPRR